MPTTTVLGGDLKLIANEAIINVGEILLPLKACARTIETEKEGLKQNDNIQVFVAGSIPEAGEFNASTNNYGTDNGGDHAFKPVKLDKRFKQTFSLQEDQLDRITSVAELAEFYKPFAQNVAKQLLLNAIALVTAANFPNSYKTAGAVVFDKSDAGKAETALAKLVGIGNPLNLVLNMEYFDYLRDSLSFLPANPTSNEVLRQGTIPGIAGFSETLRTSIIPDVPAEAGTYTVGFATNGSGLIIANGVSPSIRDNSIDYSVATDPVTGIAMAFSGFWKQDTRTYIATVETLTGAAVGSDKGLLRLVQTVS
ncbi:MAG: hypothetical protein LBC64_01870 [Fibromonadaceae bacterium]|jgi:hypothetical protein|nr:hypothetical protein [Fibromonadaceae bacterium]